MVKILAALMTFILSTSLTWGQSDSVFIRYKGEKYEEKLNYKTDTVVFDTPNARQILYGTTVLPCTNSQQIAINFGIILKNVTSSDCKQSGKPTTNEVASIAETDTTLKIDIKIWGNCCHSFLCDLEIVDDSILNLKYYGYGATYCSCDCCYGLTYNIEKWKLDAYKFLKSVMVNGDMRTITKLK